MPLGSHSSPKIVWDRPRWSVRPRTSRCPCAHAATRAGDGDTWCRVRAGTRAGPGVAARLQAPCTVVSQLLLRFMGDDRSMVVRALQKQVLWLVRHGETTWNSMGWVQGQIDGARLTRQGRHQARQVADRLAAEPIGAVYSSDLYRARRMAAVTAQRLGCEVRTDRRLRERCFGIAEGVPCGEDHGGGHRHPRTAMWSTSTPSPRGRIALRRPPALFGLPPTISRDSTKYGDVVVVAHGGSIRMLRAWPPTPSSGAWPGAPFPTPVSSAWTFPCPIWPARSARASEAWHRLRRARADACPPQHPPQIDDHLLVDVVAGRSVQRLGLIPQGHLEPTVVPSGHLGHTSAAGTARRAIGCCG